MPRTHRNKHQRSTRCAVQPAPVLSRHSFVALGWPVCMAVGIAMLVMFTVAQLVTGARAADTIPAPGPMPINIFRPYSAGPVTHAEIMKAVEDTLVQMRLHGQLWRSIGVGTVEGCLPSMEFGHQWATLDTEHVHAYGDAKTVHEYIAEGRVVLDAAAAVVYTEAPGVPVVSFGGCGVKVYTSNTTGPTPVPGEQIAGIEMHSRFTATLTTTQMHAYMFYGNDNDTIWNATLDAMLASTVVLEAGTEEGVPIPATSKWFSVWIEECNMTEGGGNVAFLWYTPNRTDLQPASCAEDDLVDTFYPRDPVWSTSGVFYDGCYTYNCPETSHPFVLVFGRILPEPPVLSSSSSVTSSSSSSSVSDAVSPTTSSSTSSSATTITADSASLASATPSSERTSASSGGSGGGLGLATIIIISGAGALVVIGAAVAGVLVGAAYKRRRRRDRERQSIAELGMLEDGRTAHVQPATTPAMVDAFSTGDVGMLVRTVAASGVSMLHLEGAVPANRISAATSATGRTVDPEEIVFLPRPVWVAGALPVANPAAPPGLAAMRIENLLEHPIEYQINTAAHAGPYSVELSEVEFDTSNGGEDMCAAASLVAALRTAPMVDAAAVATAAWPRVHESIVAAARAPGFIGQLRFASEIVGVIRARSAATFLLTVRAHASTKRKPGVCIAVGTQVSKSMPAEAVVFSAFTTDIRTIVSPSLMLDSAEVTLEGRIGSGGYGEVRRGKWRGQDVAVKVSPPSELMDDGGEALVRELSALMQLRSPYIIQLYGFYAVDRHVHIVMEVAQLGSLDRMATAPVVDDANSTERMRAAAEEYARTLPLAMRVRFAYDIARGMAFLEESGIVHRDLKPGNVLVFHTDPRMRSVCCKLTDFGTARAASAASLEVMTKGVGTPVFMAPELLEGRAVECASRSDVFSYALTVYQIFTGILPYSMWNVAMHQINTMVGRGRRLETDVVVDRLAIAASVTIAGYPPPPSVSPSPPMSPPTTAPHQRAAPPGEAEVRRSHGPQLVELIKRCWSADPTDRPTFADIQKLLTPFASEFGCYVE